MTHLTPVCLVWREFGGLNLDQWVLGNGQVSISDQFRLGQSKLDGVKFDPFNSSLFGLA